MRSGFSGSGKHWFPDSERHVASLKEYNDMEQTVQLLRHAGWLYLHNAADRR